jgi:hypothetical protein
VSRADVQDVISLSREPDCDWTLAEFRVLVNLAERRNGDTGRLDPSLQRIAEDCHMDKSNVVAVLERLEDKKAIRRSGDSKGGSGRRRPIELVCLERVALDHPSGRKRVVPAPRKGGPSTTKRVVPDHPNLRSEPGKEPARSFAPPQGGSAARPSSDPSAPLGEGLPGMPEAAKQAWRAALNGSALPGDGDGGRLLPGGAGQDPGRFTR